MIGKADHGLVEVAVGDGRPLLLFTGLGLVLSGAFALFLSAVRQFLPHDVAYLGMTANELCAFYDCRIVDFMIHDRAAFGGALVAIGVLYLWLVVFPLAEGRAWAWWTLVLSSVTGFGSFLTYLGYGYLDTWHGVATLVLLPLFVIGLVKSYSSLEDAMDARRSIRTLFRPSLPLTARTLHGKGRLLLLLTSVGMIFGGLTVMLVGITEIFVPQDLAFMHAHVDDLDAIDTKLIPLIAHDRAGFGGAVLSTGITAFFCILCGRPSRSLWQALLLAATSGFGFAIGIHLIVGYTDVIHLAPAYLGSSLFIVGLILTYRPKLWQAGLLPKEAGRLEAEES
ncbi:MAG TPA: hypothetical protein VK879_02130 [Candidatus Sulfomarinibacteraceae bacterium]|nr:hypothetical protein [Candidatus Sulfomarinibacteraceae bacterium]